MSLEAKIEELTKAVSELTATMKGGVTAVVNNGGEAGEAGGSKRGRKSKDADTATPPAAAAAPAAADPFADDAGDAFGDAPARTYTADDVRNAILGVRKAKGDDVALKIISDLGVKTLNQIEAKDYAKVIAEAAKHGVNV